MKDVYEKRANSGKLNLEKLLSKYKTFWIMSAPSLLIIINYFLGGLVFKGYKHHF